jgi:hypothetical protein
MLVYALSHPVTGGIRYIGRSSRGLERPRQHGSKRNLRVNAHLPVVRWIRKLRSEHLEYVIEVIEECSTLEALNEAERFYIAYFRSLGFRLLNICDGGEGRTGPMPPEAIAKMKATRSTPEYKQKNSEIVRSLWQDATYRQRVYEGHEKNRKDPEFIPHWTGRKHSLESRQKMSKTKKATPLTEKQWEAVKKMQASNIGRKFPPRPPEWRAKLGYWKGRESPNKGRIYDQEFRIKNSRAHGGTPISDETGAVFATIQEAARELGIAATKICSVLKGRRKTVKGHTFKRLKSP